MKAGVPFQSGTGTKKFDAPPESGVTSCRHSSFELGGPAFAVPMEDPETLAKPSEALALVCGDFDRTLEPLAGFQLGRDHHLPRAAVRIARSAPALVDTEYSQNIHKY